MNKVFSVTLSILLGGAITAQEVGINTNAPQATLDIKSSQNYPLRIGQRIGANHLFRVHRDNNKLIFGAFVGDKPSNHYVQVYPLTDDHADFAVRDTDNPNIFLKHYHMRVGKELQDYGVTMDGRGGHVFVFSVEEEDEGFYLGSYSDRANGVFIGKNGKNGIGLTSQPTETVDIEGGIKLGGAQPDLGTLAENGACTRPGEIAYNGGFWGCTSTGWKRLNN